MGRVSLILPVASAGVAAPGKVARWREALEGSGHSVDVLVVLDHGNLDPDEAPPYEHERFASGSSGLASAAMTGLREARGEVFLVLDARHDFHPDDLPGLIEPLTEGRADLVFARRTAGPGLGFGTKVRRRVGSTLGWVSRRLLGASDPFSGLVAVTPALARQLVGTFEPVGSRFTIDLAFRARGRKREAPVRAESDDPTPLRLDDFRHVKRLADDRFGTVSRLVQFCAVGASGMVIDLTCYALFQLILSRTALTRLTAPWLGGPLDLAVAGALAIALALVWNFSLNRRLTFNDSRFGSIPKQFFAYVLSNALGIALSFSLRLYLPLRVTFFARHRLAAAVVGIVTATGISFSMARWVVFSRNGDRRKTGPREALAGSKRRGRPEGPALLHSVHLETDQ